MSVKEEQTGNPLGYEPIGKLLRKFAVPAVISMLVNAIYNIVDQIFIGQGVGYLGNAATTVAFPVVTVILAASTMIGVGGSAYASIKLGEKQEEMAERTLGNNVVLLTGAGILITILGLIFLKPILTIFGATDSTMDYSMQYTSIILLGAPFNMLGIGLSNLARTDGSPSLSMYSILAGALLNVVLDPIYIFVLKWGVVGAAIATVTSQVISTVILIIYFLKFGKMRIRRQYLNLNPAICKSVLSLGISSGIVQISNTVLQVTLNNSLVYYGNQTSVGGEVALSAMGIVLKINFIIMSIGIGIGMGSQPILGFNKGAKQYGRVRSTYLRAVLAASSIALCGWAVCQLFPDQILKLFGTQDPVFTSFAVKCMKTFMLGVFVSGIQVVSTSFFQATGQPMKASFFSVLRPVVLFIPCVLILPLFFGLDGILYTGPVADIGAAFIIVLFMRKEMSRYGSGSQEPASEG